MGRIDKDLFFAKAAKALGDRTRLLIFREIDDRGSMPMLELIQLLNLAQPLVSHQVKQLVNAQLVEAQKVGREVHLKINTEKANQFFSELDQIKALTKRD